MKLYAHEQQLHISLPGVSNPQPVGLMWPKIAMNLAQHKIANYLKPFSFAHQLSLVFVYLTCGQNNSSYSRVAQRHQRLDTPATL